MVNREYVWNYTFTLSRYFNNYDPILFYVHESINNNASEVDSSVVFDQQFIWSGTHPFDYN